MSKSENYMDNFKSPEQFIRHEILANKGTDSAIFKDDLILLAQETGIEADKKMTKEEILELLSKKMPLKKVAEYCNLGVSSYSFQLKFDISHDEVKRMARLGYIKVTGNHRFRSFGKYRYADTYSVFDYYGLTKEQVKKWLKENPKGTRKAKVVSEDEGRAGKRPNYCTRQR